MKNIFILVLSYPCSIIGHLIIKLLALAAFAVPVLALAATYDYSDAPATYGTSTHTLVSGVKLGATVTADSGAVQNADDVSDDGVDLSGLERGVPKLITAHVPFTNGADYLNAWIDWNGDGDFADSGEQVATNLRDDGTGIDGTFNDGQIQVMLSVPAGAASNTWARFRYSSDASLGTTGTAIDGEVEDYAITISDLVPDAPVDPQACTSTNQLVNGDFSSGSASWLESHRTDTSASGSMIIGLAGVNSTLTGVAPWIGSNGNGIARSYVDNDGNLDDTYVNLRNETVLSISSGASYNFGFDIQEYSNSASRSSLIGWALVDATTGAVVQQIPGVSVELDGLDKTGSYPLVTTSWQTFSQRFTATVPTGNYKVAMTFDAYLDSSIAMIDFYVDKVYFAPVTVCDYSDGPADGASAPASGTTAYGATRHAQVSGIHLGASVTDETSAVFNADNASDDGAIIPLLVPGQTDTIPVTVSGTGGYLQGWIDWNGDGDFNDTVDGISEQISINAQDQVATMAGSTGDADTIPGQIGVQVTVPGNAVTTQTLSRFRWSTTQNLDSTTATGDGEVEDYMVTVGHSAPQEDYSDAPADHSPAPDGSNTTAYGTASHAVVSGIQLGSSITIDNGAVVDADNTSDDGVSVPTLTAGSTGNVVIAQANITGIGTGTLHAWIDFDGNGTFDIDEYASIGFDNGATGPLTFSGYGTAMAAGITSARFRLTSDTAVTASTPASAASDGEVEDYSLTINNQPFVCDSTLYQVLASPSVLRATVFSGSSSSFTDISASSEALNGPWGYNTLDNYIYGIKGGTQNVYRIGADGMFVLLGTAPMLPGNASNAGDVSGSGELILKLDTGSDDWAVMDLTDPTFPLLRTFTLSGAAAGKEFYDVAWNPADNMIYGVATDTTILKIDTTTGVGVVVAEPIGAFELSNIGSTWITSDGDMIGFNNTNKSYHSINLTSGESSLLSVSSPAGGLSDGASCRGEAPTPLGAISGSVYGDNDGSDTRGNGEAGFASVSVRLYLDGGTPGNDSDDTLVGHRETALNGAYSFSDVNATSGISYRIEVDTSDPDIPNTRTIGTTNPVESVTVTDGGTVTVDFGFDIKGVTVSGRVFKDINVNAVNDSSEEGVTQLPVVLYDTADNTCISTRTDGNGDYAFTGVLAGTYQVYEASRESIPVPKNCAPTYAKDPRGYLSSTDNVTAEFTVSSVDISDQNFGDIKPPVFEPDNTGQVLPGNVVFYRHKLSTPTTGNVSVAIANSGNISASWSSILYEDANCDGQLNGSDASAPVSGSLPVAANDAICLINKVYAPSNVAANDSYTQKITATFDYGNAVAGTTVLRVQDVTTAQQIQTSTTTATPAVDAAAAVPSQPAQNATPNVPATETTAEVPSTPYTPATDPVPAQPAVDATAATPEVGPSRLMLRKTVKNISKAPYTETTTANTAEPGDTLEYRVYYSNTGTGPLTTLVIDDTVPAFTHSPV